MAKRILWANPYCLLDTSSGASISCRIMLKCLQKAGYDIKIVGATVFDNIKGISNFGEHWEQILSSNARFVEIEDDGLCHQLIRTNHTNRNLMTVDEENLFFEFYRSQLKDFCPDLVMFYGGQALDILIPYEARNLNIPSMAYLVNANYLSDRWCLDVDAIITDSVATCNMYKEIMGFNIFAVGKFIKTADIIALEHKRENILFVNPSLEKGSLMVATLALILETRRPEITFEVLESRGNWAQAVELVSERHFGGKRETLKNVKITPNTSDMKSVYARAKLVLGLSQWWESGSRVLVEAISNGIPCLVSDYGGNKEMIGDGGIAIKFPDFVHEPPFNNIVQLADMEPIIEVIEKLWDSPELYSKFSIAGIQHAYERHAIEASTERLVGLIEQVTEESVDQVSMSLSYHQRHKHPLAFDATNLKSVTVKQLRNCIP